jgi:hypothetical protein
LLPRPPYDKAVYTDTYDRNPRAEALAVANVVETLIDLDLVDLEAEGPWRAEPEGADAYEPDWNQVHLSQADLASVATDMPENPGPIFDEVRRRASGGFKLKEIARQNF